MIVTGSAFVTTFTVAGGSGAKFRQTFRASASEAAIIPAWVSMTTLSPKGLASSTAWR